MKYQAIAPLFAFGLLALGAAPSGAVTLHTSEPGTIATTGLLQEVASRSDRHQMRKSWDRHRDGGRCRSRSSHCRHYHNGYWYATPWWTLPLIGGSIILNSQRHHTGSSHVAWCEDHYRSYNRRSNTWVAYSGAVRQCVSPYGP